MNSKVTSRRGFLRRASATVAGVAALGALPGRVRAQADSRGAIRVGLVGCGGRGAGAAANILEAEPSATLVALADLFPDRALSCRQQLGKLGAEIPEDRCYSGFDAYRKICEHNEINYVILATPPHFRPEHLRACVEAGKHTFIEKPVAVDATGVRSVLESGEIAKKKGLTVVAGTQRRHQADYLETVRRLRDGAIGDLVVGEAYYNTGTLWHRGRNADWSEMEFQCRNWYYFTWLSGDHIVEQHIHNLDLMNWVFNSHPVRATANGGRQVRTDAKFGNIYDHFAVEFEYANGARVYSYCRQTDGCEGKVADRLIGVRGTSNGRNLIEVKKEKPWRLTDKVRPGHVQEHVDMAASIREQRALNETRSVAESTLMAIMGREAAYSGVAVEWDAALQSKQKLGPKSYALTAEAPEVIVPMPGRYKPG